MLQGSIAAAGTKCISCPGAMEYQLHVLACHGGEFAVIFAEALSVDLPHAANLK